MKAYTPYERNAAAGGDLPIPSTLDQLPTEGVEGRSIGWTNPQEGKSGTVKTYAAVTAGGYHAGLVNTVMLDGSSRRLTDDVDLIVRRPASTRS